MAQIQFYEKPGCINNTKQKKILMDAGHNVEAINILEFEWTAETLSKFVAEKSASQMMNHTAPAVKSGQIEPKKLNWEEALKLMIEEPILIKRPLVAVDDLFIQGFDDERMKPYLGSWKGEEDVITCPNLKTISCDDATQQKN